jgi:hypothetical protein
MTMYLGQDLVVLYPEFFSLSFSKHQFYSVMNLIIRIREYLIK